MKTALEQNREDQALGAAWRRCEAALDHPHILTLVSRYPPYHGDYQASVGGSAHPPATGRTPTEALTALAKALEARRE